MSTKGQFAALCLTLGLAACGGYSGTEFTSTWTPGDVQPVSAEGKHIAAVFISSNSGTRRVAEDELAQELTRYGALGIPAYTLVAEDPRNEDASRRALEQAGVDAVVSMRVVSHDTQTTFEPSYWSGPYYRSLWGYWSYGWGSVYEPGYLRTTTRVGVETLVYSTAQNRLVWAGMSQTFNEDDIDDVVEEIVRKAVKKMKTDGVLVQ
jgi:hypothetical protein